MTKLQMMMNQMKTKKDQFKLFKKIIKMLIINFKVIYEHSHYLIKIITNILII